MGFICLGINVIRMLHKQNLPYGIDITEIEGFDNLHHAEEIIMEAEVRAASMYHAEETHYLINGVLRAF